MSEPDVPLPWHRRTDLIARAQGRHWVLKDPVAQRHFQLGREAYFVWEQLNGRTSATAICAAFSRQFAPRQLTSEQLRQFLGQLLGQGLVWSEAAGSGDLIERRRASASAFSWWSKIFGLLSIRLRGIDPDRWLTSLAKTWGWLFSPAAAVAGLLLILSALGLWLTHLDDFASRLPEEVARWSVSDIGTFAVVLAGLKILHELGHAIACKRYGGEVRELGVLFLVFTPCLYCNVSDAWLLPSRWQRLVISAAGMWIELLIAALCLWLWWGSEPGWFHATCLQIVFLATVSTLLFNLNPLLRYDGYFLLSDATGIPNLQQRATRELGHRVRALAGLVSEPRPRDLQPTTARWLAVYAAASLIYRIWMVFTIVWIMDRWLEPQGLRLLSQLIAASTIGALVLAPVMALWHSLRTPESRRMWQFDRPVRLLLTATVLAVILLWPWPGRILAPMVLMPANARGVFVTQAGELTRVVPAGSEVQQGDVIAVLRQPELERELVRLEGEVARARQLVESLQRRQILDERVRWQMPAAERHLQNTEAQRAQRERESQELIVRAPQSGRLWPVPAATATTGRTRLPGWTGSPLESRNLGCWLEAGTQLGWIGTGSGLEAMAIVSQTEAARIPAGAATDLVADSARSHRMTGTVGEISNTRLGQLSANLTRRLRLPEVAAAEGTRLVGTWYQIRIPLQETPATAVAMGIGTVAIHTAPESLLDRSSRWLRETFSVLR